MVRLMIFQLSFYSLRFPVFLPVSFPPSYRGQDTKRNFAHAKQFCSRNPLAGVSFRTFAFDYSQHGIFAQIQLHADLSVGLPGGYQRQYLWR